MRDSPSFASFATGFLALVASTAVAWAQAAETTLDVAPEPATDASSGPVDNAATSDTVRALLDWARDAYDRDPQLVTAMVVMVLGLTALSLLALFYTGGRRVFAALGRAWTARAKAAAEPTRTTSGIAVKRTVPALEMVDDGTTAVPVRGAMIRIGRHEENDICLASKSVHRYHAVLHLTDAQGYTITDLSGLDGNGVFVNAERVDNAELQNGDLIELGDVKLRFRLNELH
jgi:FHA domain